MLVRIRRIAASSITFHSRPLSRRRRLFVFPKPILAMIERAVRTASSRGGYDAADPPRTGEAGPGRGPHAPFRFGTLIDSKPSTARAPPF